MLVYIGSILVVLVALGCLYKNYSDLKQHKEGKDEMKELAAIIRDGAKTFLGREYRIIIPTLAIVAGIYTACIEVRSGVTMLLGGTLASLAVLIGMRGGTYANVRTANAARKTKAMSRTIRIALMGGSTSGFAVQAFGLLGLDIILLAFGGMHTAEDGVSFLFHIAVNPLTSCLTTYGLGCSLVAMFNRVAGGNYTKAADISADIVGKNVHNLPEDDSRMPNTVADFIGDCVNDIAGNVSDLLESFVATPVACILIALQLFKDNPELLNSAVQYPILLATGGLVSTLIGVDFIILKNRKKKKKVKKNGIEEEVEVSPEVKNPGAELNAATYLSAITVMVIGLIAAREMFDPEMLPANFRLGWYSPWVAALLGIVSSVAVGKITEYYTSTKYKPVQDLARMATEGEAFVVTKGDAIGMRSVLLPTIVIGVSMIVANASCGTYGIAIAALGMLSFVGTTVSIDAFGPVADNAGGIAESCHLDAEVRVITDALDAEGNTTAAIGKGNAIGAAAFATVALILSYLGSFPLPEVFDYSLVVEIIVGGIIGGALIMYFSAILTDNTIKAAKILADVGEKELARPGVLEGTVRPNYQMVIQLASDQALKYMLLPSVLALVIPVFGGFLFGPLFILGVLAGSVIVAIGLAIYNGNSGGAFDNAKKLIESGELKKLDALGKPVMIRDKDGQMVAAVYEKGSAPHKAAVVGDTVGDTRKDVVGVALDIFIKLMSTVANTLAPLFYAYRLF